MKTLKTHILCLSILLVSSCAQDVQTGELNQDELSKVEKEDKALLKQSDINLTSNKEVFTIDPSQSTVLTTANGTRVHIDKNSLIDENGNNPESPVDFEVMEFNTIGEIIASNIPMVYENPQGEKEQFVSAGMFSLNAFHKGKKLSLKPNSKMKVEYASTVDGPFNFYRLKDDSTNWVLKDTKCIPKKNPYLKDKKDELAELVKNQPTPEKPVVSYKPNDRVFDIKTYKSNDSQLEMLNGVVWKYIGNDAELDPYNRKADFSHTFELQKMEDIDTSFLAFTLTFRDKKTKKSFSIPCAPVFQGKLLDLENEKFAQSIKALKASLRSQEELAAEMKREKELLRIFEVEDFGIYNYDIKWTDNDLIPFIADFQFDGNNKELANVFLIPSNKRIVVKYTPSTAKDFAMNPQSFNRLIAILPDNSIYLLDSKAIKAMNLSREKEGTKVLFNLKKVNKKVESASDLDDLVATL